MTDDDLARYRLNFMKRVGGLEVSSYGGAHPRSATISRRDRDGQEIRLSMEEVLDLRYALDRLVTLTGEQP